MILSKTCRYRYSICLHIRFCNAIGINKTWWQLILSSIKIIQISVNILQRYLLPSIFIKRLIRVSDMLWLNIIVYNVLFKGISTTEIVTLIKYILMCKTNLCRITIQDYNAQSVNPRPACGIRAVVFFCFVFLQSIQIMNPCSQIMICNDQHPARILIPFKW